MTNEVLDRAAGYATCQILESAGYALVGAGAWSLGAGGAGIVPITLGSLSLLGAGFACQEFEVDGSEPQEEQIEGCSSIASGGYGQFQYKKPGGDWLDATSKLVYSRAIRIGEVQSFRRLNGEWTSSAEVFSADGSALFQEGGEYPTESEANQVRYRIDPTNGNCDNFAGPVAPLPPEAYEPIPYTDPITNCTYNVQLLGFVEAFAGGTQDPVYVISGSEQLRASGGRVGGCNFNPTVYYGGSGGGGGFGNGDGAPPFPYLPGEDPSGRPDWLDTLISALTGAATAIVADGLIDAIQDQFATTYPEVIYRMVSVCEKDKDGEPISEAIEVPIAALKAPDAQIARLDALVALLQGSKNFKQPICETVTPEPDGEFRTIHFRSASASPNSNSRLRKLFRYRSTSGLGLDEVTEYWKDFIWESGPYRVRHNGSSWGSLEVWAASEDEGKRVIRHAGGEAGIDPDQVGRWSTRRSNSSRLGLSDTMSVDKSQGYYMIKIRDGSDGPAFVA